MARNALSLTNPCNNVIDVVDDASNFPLKNLAALHMRIIHTHNTNLSSSPEPPFLLEDIAEYLRSKFVVFSTNIKQRSAVCG